MLNDDLFEVLVPVLLEAQLFFSFCVELGHHVADAQLESFLELQVVFVTEFDNRLVMQCVLDLDLGADLVLLQIGFDRLSWAFWSATFGSLLWTTRWSLSQLGRGRPGYFTFGSLLVLFLPIKRAVLRAKLLLEVDLEDDGPESWELSRRTLRHVFVAVHGDQVLDVLVLLLDNLVTWQLDEVLLAD